MAIHNQSNYRVEVLRGDAPIRGLWTEFEGGESTRPVTKVRDGGRNNKTVVGLPDVGDITLSRPFDTDDDAWLPQLVRNFHANRAVGYTISKQKLSETGGNLNRPEQWTDCTVVSISSPTVAINADANAAMLEIVFSANNRQA